MAREYDYDLFDPLDMGGDEGAMPSRTFVESIIAGFEDADLNASQAGAENYIREGWIKSLKTYEDRFGPSGIDTDFITAGDMGDFVDALQGKPVRSLGIIDLIDPTRRSRVEAARKKFAEINKTLSELGDPNLKSFEQILAEAQAEARAREREMGIVSEGGSGFGQFIGGVAGSFTGNNPINQVTLGIGGVGKSIFGRIAAEGLAAGLFEGVGQFTGAQRNRDILGLEEIDPWEQIIMAAAGGAAIQGGFEGLGYLFRNFRMPTREEQTGPEVPPRSASRREPEPGLPPGAGPEARAYESFREDAEAYEQANPHQGSNRGNKFEEDVKAADDFMEGNPREDRGPAKDYASAEEELAGESPNVVNAYKQATVRLQDIEQRIAAVQEIIDNVPMSRVFEDLDSAKSVLAAHLEKTIADPEVPDILKAKLIQKIQKMADDIGQEQVKRERDKIVKDSVDELAQLQKERKTAKASHDAHKKRFDTELEKIRLRKAKETQEKARAEEAKRRAEEGEPAGPRTEKPEDVDEAVKASSARTERAAAGEDAEGAKAEEPGAKEAKTEKPKRKRAKVDADGNIDLGNGKKLPANMKVEVEVDGEVQTKTVKEIIEEFFEDEELLDAMKACAI